MANLTSTNVLTRTLAAFNAGKRYIVEQGGTGSSKTWSILQALYLIAHYSEKPLMISAVSESFPHLKRGVVRDFMEILGDAYSEDDMNRTDMIYTVNKSKIEFFSADQSSKVRGPRRDILYINECNNLSEPTFTQLEIRTRGAIFLDFNPVSEFWAHTLAEKDNAVFIKSTYRDNPYLPQTVIDALERRRETDPMFWRVYGLGEIGTAEGLIFTFELIDDWPMDIGGKDGYGLDFGYTSDPTALIRAKLHDRTLYLDECLYETRLTNQDIVDRLQRMEIPKNAFIVADSAEPKSIEEIYRCGYRNLHPSEKGPDSVRNGIQAMKAFHIKITKRSLNLIKEARNYAWARDKEGKQLNVPIDNWNHGWDAARYVSVALVKKLHSAPLLFAFNKQEAALPPEITVAQ